MSNLSNAANISIIVVCVLAYLTFGRMCAQTSLGNGRDEVFTRRGYIALYLAIMFFWPILYIVEPFLP